MIIEIRILNDDGTLAKGPFTGPAHQPVQWKTQYEQPLIDGEYKVYGGTYQPMAVLDRTRR